MTQRTSSRSGTSTVIDYANDVVEVKNQANIDVRGGVVDEETYDFLGISNPATANKIAARVLKTVSTPLARLTLSVNRKAFNLHRCSVQLDWALPGSRDGMPRNAHQLC